MVPRESHQGKGPRKQRGGWESLAGLDGGQQLRSILQALPIGSCVQDKEIKAQSKPLTTEDTLPGELLGEYTSAHSAPKSLSCLDSAKAK